MYKRDSDPLKSRILRILKGLARHRKEVRNLTLLLLCCLKIEIQLFIFQIREDWKFVAMVVDRLQLYVFFIVTTVGTIGILMDAPHIFEYVDQDKIIDIYRGK